MMKWRPMAPVLALLLAAALRPAAGLSLRSSDAGGGDHVCPVTLPTKAGDTGQEPYFKELHTALVEGNGVLEGAQNASSQEYYVKTFENELKCLYAIMLSEKCGGLPSKHATRQEPWEKACLDPKADLLDAYDLMDAAEQKYFHLFKKEASERQIYATYLELAGYKELVCIYMKTVDDDCLAFKKPRFLPPGYWHKQGELTGKK
mmetsp:Transcript_83849/g.213495  ORF Transcript_83849/g.213495 Transcript_83849/m.213495 type:complete len:204 (+) Transcript_83849:86-697(+)